MKAGMSNMCIKKVAYINYSAALYVSFHSNDQIVGT